MASRQQIISDLRVAQEAGHDLEIFTVYKGAPFVAPVHISAVEENSAHFQARHPILAAVHTGQTLRLLGKEYFEPVSCVVESINLPAGEMVLGNFTYSGTRLGDRMIVRVEPQQPCAVTLKWQKEAVGELADISMSGLGVRIASGEYDSFLKPGADVAITLALPNRLIEAAGRILSAIHTGDCYRLSISFPPEYPQKLDVFHYLIDRRSQIEEELQRLYADRLSSNQAG